MHLLQRRLRSLLIALAVLALSAGAVLAGRSGLSTQVRTDQVAGHAEGSENEQAETPDTDETAPAETPDTSETDVPDTNTTDASTTEHPDNHGKLVSEAAQGETPAGFDNHGAFVRTIAMDNQGHATAGAASTTATAAKAKHTKHTH